ncbi:MAG: hypothetical protein EOP24_27770 [Hyphomicrobiales bacterium]|nr:MAG: hypothetical protein EOP24_27770 [Hyphomicrobiales bacterium]
MTDTNSQRQARREADRHKYQVGLERKKDRKVMVVVRRMLVEYEQGRAASSCMAEIRKAAQ